MGTNEQALKCIILTTRSELVIVPNAAVAEIAPVQDVSNDANKPGWYLGTARWRGVNLPLISFEAAGGDTAHNVRINTQVAVLYTMARDADKKHPYVGLVISGVPHVSHFTKDQIKPNTETPNRNPIVAQKVRVNGAAANILDFAKIEAMLDDVA
jgi:chemosensory pili system protein ChpC